MMLRSLTVAVGGVLLALASALSSAPASANLVADLAVTHTVSPPPFRSM